MDIDKRIEVFHNEGVTAITEEIVVSGYDFKIEIPKGFRWKLGIFNSLIE